MTSDGSNNEKDAKGREDLSKQASRVSNNATSQELIGNVTDPVLVAKTCLLNQAIDDVGWTSFHLKLSCLTGFGFAVDSLVAFLQSVAARQAYLEIGNGGYQTASTMALYCGLLVGALFWGFFADSIGRRLAFNTTLFIAASATIVAGAAPNWIFFSAFVGLLGFGAGGNLVLDPTVMLEFLPSSKQWVVTALAGWWGVGQATAGFIAWGFYSRGDWSCDGTDCTWQNNRAWRLIMFTGGAIVFVMSALRIFVVRLPETPRYLLASGQDEKLVAVIQNIATKHNRPCSINVEMLQACGQTQIGVHESNQPKIGRVITALFHQSKGLFETRKLALSTVLVWISWLGIGLGYPLFFLYLPQVTLTCFIVSLLASRVPNYEPTFTETWRDYTITNICSIFGPLIAGALVDVKALGRRYTMTIGAIITAALFFGYTAIRTPAQNLALSSLIAVFINLYYGTLYAYTVETFPSAHRTTGNGIAIALNRLMGLVSAVIAASTDSATSTPLYVSAAVFVVLAIISALLPFEPCGKSPS